VGLDLAQQMVIHSTPFGGEVKLEVLCCKILWHVKVTCKYEQKYFAKPNSAFTLPIPPACYQVTLLVGLLESSGVQIRSFSMLTSLHHGSPFSYITWEQVAHWWPQFRDVESPH
jgi:hypothetical protein